MQLQNFPPPEVYQDDSLRKDFELIILWTLSVNTKATWSDFLSPPLSLKPATLSNYLKQLMQKGYIVKERRAEYQITERGREHLISLHQKRKIQGENLRFPPKIIASKRNYRDIIIWMLFNNESCRWSDFTSDPVQINQSSLSKSLTPLLENQLVKKISGEYVITESGKHAYEDMIKNYDLDNQSLLEEKSKLLKDLTNRTLIFFEKYNIDNDDIRFRFVDLKILLSYSVVKNLLPDEEDFDKILLYFSFNHPENYPNHISTQKFAAKYGIHIQDLEHYVWKIAEQDLYAVKFFTIETDDHNQYYFHAEGRIDKILKASVNSYVTKLHFLNQLNQHSPEHSTEKTLTEIIKNVLKDMVGFLFHPDLRDALERFLPDYIGYLAYEFERSPQRGDSESKIGELFWNDFHNVLEEDPRLDEKVSDCKCNLEDEDPQFVPIHPQIYQNFEIFTLTPVDLFFAPEISHFWITNRQEKTVSQFKTLFENEDFEVLEKELHQTEPDLTPLTATMLNFMLDCAQCNFEDLDEHITVIKKNVSAETEFLINLAEFTVYFITNRYNQALTILKSTIEEFDAKEHVHIKFLLTLFEIQIYLHTVKKNKAKKTFKSLLQEPIISQLFFRIYFMIVLTFSHKVIRISNKMISILSDLPDSDEKKIMEIFVQASLRNYAEGFKLLNLYFPDLSAVQSPKNHRMILALSVLLEISARDFDSAEKTSKELENRFPEHSMSYMVRGIYYGYNWLINEDQSPLTPIRFHDYIEYAAKMEHSNFRLSGFYFFESHIYSLQNDYQQALTAIDKALSFSPENIFFIFQKTYLMFKNGLKAEVEAFIDSLFEKSDEYALDYAIVKFKYLLWQNQREELYAFTKAQLQLFDESPDLKNHLTYGYFHFHDYELALVNAKELIDKEPDKLAYIDTLGEAYYLNQQYTKAIKRFQEVIDKDPGTYFIWETHIKLGLCFAASGQLEKAKRELKEGIRIYFSLYTKPANLVEEANQKLNELLEIGSHRVE